MRRALVLSMVLLVVGATAACSRGSGTASARWSVDGQAHIAHGQAPFAPAGDGGSLRAGDRLRVDDGSAVVRLSADRQLALRKGSQLELASGPSRSELALVLTAGDLLVTAPGRPEAVGAGDTTVTVSGGSTHLSRGLATAVASYAGSATIDSAGRSLVVPALRQASVAAAGLLPPRPTPLAYSASDPWDQRFLGDAIELGNQLVARSRGFTAQLGPGEGTTPGFFRQIIPALDREPAFDTPLLDPARPPGETLVGAAIVAEGKRGTFVDRWNAVFSFHDEGAAWGLVALDQGVDRAPLLADVDAAIGRGPAIVAEGAPPKAPATRPPTTTSRRRSTTGSRTTSTAAPGGRVPPSSTSPSAGTTGPANTGLPLVDNTVNALVDVLGGLLRGLGRT